MRRAPRAARAHRLCRALSLIGALGLIGACDAPPEVVRPPAIPSNAPPVRPIYVGALRTDARSSPRDFLVDVNDDGSLRAALQSADADVRRVAARGLAWLPSDAAGQALLAVVGDEPAAETQTAMCFALGQWGDVSIGAKLSTLLTTSPWAPVRSAAAEALGKTHDDGHTGILIDALNDDDGEVRGQAALALFRLDGRRYEHDRWTSDDERVRRDEALAAIALQDPDVSARWRAVYALAEIPGRGGRRTVLEQCLRDEDARVRVFAVRGLGKLTEEGFGDAVAVSPLVWDDPDNRVAMEAVAVRAPFEQTAWLIAVARQHKSAGVRHIAVDALPNALGDSTGPDRRQVLDLLWSLAHTDDSRVVRRRALAGLITLDRDAQALDTLSRSNDRRDRAAAADLLAEGAMRADAVLDDLLGDVEPMVRVSALAAMADPRFLARTDRLHDSLRQRDPAVRTAAAQAAKPHIESGQADPALLSEVAAALEDSQGFELVEARQALQDAMGLPRGAPWPPRPAGGAPLLDRLLSLNEAARADPRPRVRLDTDRGPLLVELHREAAPRHVESFLELAEAGFYDGLDIHRVVPNFVVQGLDPRGDGWGVGGRRMPDEFNTLAYDTGVIGMPSAGEPHTGGCQIFFTHIPTPHLDGRYTAFGRIVEGESSIPRFEIGDRIRSVRRVP